MINFFFFVSKSIFQNTAKHIANTQSRGTEVEKNTACGLRIITSLNHSRTEV